MVGSVHNMVKQQRQPVTLLAFVLLLAVAYAQELDTHGDPFAEPPYSWSKIDVTSSKACELIREVGQTLSMRLLYKNNGPAQIIKTNAIWNRVSKTNENEDFIINSYILYTYLIIARNDTLFECMTPVEDFTPVYNNYRWPTSTNLRIFDTTCRPIPVRNCQTNLAENKIVIDRKSPKALEARQAINDFIDKFLNPNRFEQLLYKVDVLMGVSCAYQQGNKVCLDLYEQRISDTNVELRPCSGCMEKKTDGTWDFGQPTCYPGDPFVIGMY
ncbi:hypothetical protein Bhyg_04890 [Pseudolycoriella hygida]|uniref:Secreted protein n=1 Tax=Pseudolycoriella hygida TaxID=35572 RepID=A0A9Q0NG32_9DIPT|nr:hypothetical protein Bhyg_04890 [Pseudolycoriella hygida]